MDVKWPDLSEQVCAQEIHFSFIQIVSSNAEIKHQCIGLQIN